MKRDSKDKPLAMQDGSDVLMSDVAVLSALMEYRNFMMEGMPETSSPLERVRYLGAGPGEEIHRLALRRLEESQSRGETLDDEVEKSLQDLSFLGSRSIYIPLSEAEIWRLCYRLAYLVGYGIHVARDARAAIEKDRTRVARNAGFNRWKQYGPIRVYVDGQLPDMAYDATGNRRTKGEAARALMEALSKRYPSTALPKAGEGTIGDWLTEWRQALSYPDWRRMPQRLEDWSPALRAQSGGWLE